ncbi:MAG: hypothetical protein KKH98_01190 [Spirochaetes bacterium]|nr:hypothetical protein [Spirochaetota bacterium]
MVRFVKKNKDHDIIIFTDLFGGSCFNICSSLVNKKNVRIISGLNLGVLLEAILLKNSNTLDEVVNALERKKNDTIIYVNKKLIK